MWHLLTRPLLPYACTCDTARPLRDDMQTLRTHTGPRTMSPSRDGDREDGALSQHEGSRHELGQPTDSLHLPFIVR